MMHFGGSVIAATLFALCFTLVSAVVSGDEARSALPKNLYLLNIGGLQHWNSATAIGSNVQNGKVILLTTWFGAYPCIGCSHQHLWCNGGLPQLANMTIHEAAIKRDLDFMVPLNFTGLLVNDYESWTISWNYTSAIYKNASILLARTRFPNASADTIERIAAAEFEAAAEDFLVKTIETIKKLRPKAEGLGFYGYPSVFTFWGNVSEAPIINDRFMKLWNTVTAFYPSLYLPYMSDRDVSYARNKLHLTQQLTESHRLSQRVQKKKLIAPYTWYRYHPGEPHAWQFLTEKDAELEFDYPFSSGLGVDAAIIWGSERNATAVNATENYLVSHKNVFEGGERWVQPLAQERQFPTSAAALSADIDGLGDAAKEFALQGIPPYTRCSL